LLTVNAQTGTSYTLVPADQFVTINNASACVVTIPNNPSITVGTQIAVVFIGTGLGSIAAAAGVVLNSVTAGTGAVTTRWSSIALVKTGATEWLALGDIGTVA